VRIRILSNPGGSSPRTRNPIAPSNVEIYTRYKFRNDLLLKHF
jgi:hypothetical protein